MRSLLYISIRRTLLFVLIGCGAVHGRAQLPRNVQTDDDLIRRPVVAELQALRIEGCTLTKTEQLLGVIQSRPSELSLTRQLSRYYLENLYRNAATPTVILQRLDSIQHDLKNELRYYDPRVAESDSAELMAYLNQNGFHNGAVSYRFVVDTSTMKNTLIFTIDEGPRAVIDTVIYLGLDSLHPEVYPLVATHFTKKNTPYSEHSFESDVQAMEVEMRNNGYFTAHQVKTIVGSDITRRHDTIVILFDVGRRYRIQHIEFVESRNGQPYVTESIRESQLEFAVGEWYSAKKIHKTRMNLLSLGVFDVVTIDTVSARDSLPTAPPNTDSTLSIKVFTKNIKVYDVGFDLMVYQTAIDNYLNLGLGTTALYRNTFHGAQSTTLTAQYIFQDVSGWLQGRPFQTEAIAALQETWPFLTKIFDQRAGLTIKAMYSLRRLIDPFRLQSSGLKFGMPITLNTFTYFNGIEFSLGLERQVPIDYATTTEEALKNAQNRDDSLLVYQTVAQFTVLNDYLVTTGNLLTGVFPGVQLRGEHRDNPVNPTSGTFSNVAIEVGLGAGDFARLQFYNSAFTRVDTRLVFASKVKLGHIQVFDVKNLYVPIERQFFSGGASSIRSYQSRALHSPVSGVFRDSSTGAINEDYYSSNLVGSGTLIEFGFELRYTFPRPDNLSTTFADMIEKSGITFFCDIGSAFNRLSTNLYGKMTWNELLTGSVVAAGLGYRFDTPVGPFRVDYATSIYDPLRTTGKFIVGREGPLAFSNWQLSIGLGHAF